ncbi:probable methyltransferase-like protein 25 [Diorhabda carinulata]|uniref:probable methyltransferase-like protein 25 n=1 Tax=Diorhabda carinulata TaxID=1163345 RepID=UPI0025A2D4CF|nr:probable methyltransferase-like protein 25 [Diorhabda carinulata]
MKILKEQITSILDYLQPLLPLANFHMVDYFTKNAFEQYVPDRIKEDVLKVGFKEGINCIFENDYKKMKNLKIYSQKSKKFTLKNLNICLKTDDFQEKLASLGCSEPLRLKLNIFMTSKKSHEVDILSYVAAAIHNVSGTTHLVDIGDGKGYLSSILALHHKIPVLGVDASEVNTSSAVSRVKKLSRVWKSVVSSSNNIQTEKNIPVSANLYKQVTQYITSDTDFLDLISNVFLEKPADLGLVGLHTCGNLAPTSLQIFSSNQNIKTICNIGCCYHLLSEEFGTQQYFRNTNGDYGFPMSNFLKDQNITIGRAGRMIAAQSMERILDKRELPNESIFYRALFEIILEKYYDLPSDKRQVGKMRKKCVNFVDYTKKALKRLNLPLNLTNSQLENLFEEYKERQYEIYFFYLLRNMLAPIIESLILLDRLLYLQELGFENSYIVQVFDPIVSPRCYGLIAIK